MPATVILLDEKDVQELNKGQQVLVPHGIVEQLNSVVFYIGLEKEQPRIEAKACSNCQHRKQLANNAVSILECTKLKDLHGVLRPTEDNLGYSLTMLSDFCCIYHEDKK